MELKHYFDIMNSVLCKRYLILSIQKYSLPGCAVFIIMTELIKTNDISDANAKMVGGHNII